MQNKTPADNIHVFVELLRREVTTNRTPCLIFVNFHRYSLEYTDHYTQISSCEGFVNKVNFIQHTTLGKFVKIKICNIFILAGMNTFKTNQATKILARGLLSCFSVFVNDIHKMLIGYNENHISLHF